MRIGVNTLIWSIRVDLSVLPFDQLEKAPIDGVEIPLFTPAEIDVPALRRALDDHGLACTACSVNPVGANPISDDASERRQALDHWRRVVDAAAEIGVELIAGPSYAPVGYLPGRRRSADERRRAVEFHQALAPALEDAGVDLAIEPINRFETYFLNTAADAAELVDQIAHPRIGILLDTFHSNIEDKDVAAAYRLCGGRLKHVHACENDRGTPGSGHVDWLGVLRTLRDIGYDDWLTIESFNANAPELAAATAIWRDLAASPDDIAVRGATFLQALAGAVALRADR